MEDSESRIVWTNGCFDILHIGHIELFKFCKSQGDRVVVGIDSDSRVQQLKGSKRPVNHQNDRREMLLSIRYIDEVVIFNSNKELENFIKTLKPRMVIGAHYKHKTVIGADHATGVTFFDIIGNYSTTNMIDEIISRGVSTI